MRTRHSLNFHMLRREEHGFMMADLIVGMAILTIAILPLAYSFAHEAKLFRGEYYRGAAMEIVDGEMEVLAAGEWRNFHDGQQAYTVHANAAANLPPGHFQLTKTGNRLRLEWTPDKRRDAKPVVREITIK
jgi:hypothetical protein